MRVPLKIYILTKSGKKTRSVMLVTHFEILYFNRDLNSDKYLLLSAKLAPKSRDYRTQHISVASSHNNFEVIFSFVYCCKGCTLDKAS